MEDEKIYQYKALVSRMYDFLKLLQTKSFYKRDLEQFYTVNAEMIINGLLVAKGITEFYEHFKLIAEKPCKYSLIFTENPMIVEDKRLAIQYKIEMSGEQLVVMYSMVFFTFSNGKICQWDQVVSTLSAVDMQLTHL
jgi:hypothetical protein